MLVLNRLPQNILHPSAALTKTNPFQYQALGGKPVPEKYTAFCKKNRKGLKERRILIGSLSLPMEQWYCAVGNILGFLEISTIPA